MIVHSLFIALLLIVIGLFMMSQLVLCSFVFGIYLLSIIIKRNTHLGNATCFFVGFVVVWIIFLNVNPYKPTENKLTILDYIPKAYTPASGMLWNESPSVLQNLRYPVVLKPVRCTALSRGIVIVNNPHELVSIGNDILENPEYMYQEYIDWGNEVGILYEYGNIVSIVRKDGNEKIRAYCKACTDITYIATPELTSAIQSIASSIPNFNVGRFDIRYQNHAELMKGNFMIVEANGTLGFDLRKTTSNFITGGAFTVRWFIMRLVYGLYNILSMNAYDPLTLLHVMLISICNTLSCMDWEKLFALYS